MSSMTLATLGLFCGVMGGLNVGQALPTGDAPAAFSIAQALFGILMIAWSVFAVRREVA